MKCENISKSDGSMEIRYTCDECGDVLFTWTMDQDDTLHINWEEFNKECTKCRTQLTYETTIRQPIISSFENKLEVL